MSYRFLPWVRRGLAARIEETDPISSDLPVRARLPVRVTVSTGDFADVTLKMYGPGDVIGLDPRTILRTEPVRFARNFPPEQMPAIEFDAPDLPWMFTPAAANNADRLRPWLVLVVVEKQEGVKIGVSPVNPLPTLTISDPALPSAELPDLSDSWAWAHAHVVEEAAPTSLVGYLRDQPNLNVSRLLCPRRLKPDRDYLACLVPAFDVGRRAGLGMDVPETTASTAPAWKAEPTVTLPLYFHWEFRTGPAGDFETLARRLVPRPVPDTVGRKRMSLASAHPALPAFASPADGIVKLEGALRAPEAGTGEVLPVEVAPWISALTELLELPAKQTISGASADAEAVAPPIYGGHHVKMHVLDASAPLWLRELNSDPRHRAAAGIGTEMVRLNQERFMQSAWEQVGDVLKANALLDRARFVQEIADRIHRRHVQSLSEISVLALSAPVHSRVEFGGRSMARHIERSTIPAGTFEAGFRRISSPRSVTLTRASRAHGLEQSNLAHVAVVSELAAGKRQLDLEAKVPDGIVTSRLLERIPDNPGLDVGRELGTVGTVAVDTVTALRRTRDALRDQGVPSNLELRPDVGISGIALGHHVSGLAETSPETPVFETLRRIRSASSSEPTLRGFAVEVGDGSTPRISALTGISNRSLVATEIEHLSAASPVGVSRRRTSRAALPTADNVREAVGREGATIVPPLETDRHTIDRFVDAFNANRKALAVSVGSIIPAAAPLDLPAVKATLVQAVNPAGVIVARARLAIRIRHMSLADGALAAHAQLWQRAPLDPIMVGPLIPEPLYGTLAKADPERFLPGIGEIPDDTVTILETNPRFVEAFMVGANHEMNRELLWRGYPTDRRGTPFRHFWDRIDKKEDCGRISDFDAGLELGRHTGDDLRGSLVLLVRGQLLRRYPNAIVCAVPSHVDGTLNLMPSLRKDPVFWGRMDPDVTFVGFDLTVEQITPAPGWYFIIAEQPTEPRFGMDLPPVQRPASGFSPPVDWSDLHWGHVDVDEGAYLKLAANPLAGVERRVIADSSATASFGRTSADFAAMTFQRPGRAAIHSSKLVEGVAGAGDGGIRPILARSILLKPLRLGGTS